MGADSWDLESLRDFVKSSGEASQRPIEIIDSIDRAIQLFRYHLYEAKDANDRIDPKSPREAVELVLTPSDKVEALHREKIIIQANTQSAAQNARSIHDIFAQLANCLILQDAIEVVSCDIYRVKDKLDSGPLKQHLELLLLSPEYRYINAMVNTIKHRNLVPFGAQVSMESGDAGVRFQSFEYKDEPYPKLWAEEVLEYSLYVKNSVVIAGALLKEHVSA